MMTYPLPEEPNFTPDSDAGWAYRAYATKLSNVIDHLNVLHTNQTKYILERDRFDNTRLGVVREATDQADALRADLIRVLTMLRDDAYDTNSMDDYSVFRDRALEGWCSDVVFPPTFDGWWVSSTYTVTFSRKVIARTADRALTEAHGVHVDVVSNADFCFRAPDAGFPTKAVWVHERCNVEGV